MVGYFDCIKCTQKTLLVKLLRELGWVEDLGSGIRKIKKCVSLLK